MSKNDTSGNVLSDGELLDELWRLHDELGRTPKAADMVEKGAYSIGTYHNRFGGWNAAKERAGLDCHHKRATEEELVQSIRHMGGKTAPTRADMDEDGDHPTSIFTQRFGSWNEALEAAGYVPNHRNGIPDDELLNELHRLKDDQGRIPTQRDMSKNGAYSGDTYYNRFGEWDAVLEAAGLDPTAPRGDRHPSIGELLGSLREVDAQIDGPVRSRHIQELTPHSSATYYRRFDTIREALEEAGLDWEPHAGELHHCYEGHAKKNYGPNWEEQREKALERDNYQCRGCGMSSDGHREKYGVDLHVHHIISFEEYRQEKGVDYERANRLTNLVSHCASCHRRWEGVPIQPQLPTGSGT